jgi:hypothetical protein
MVLDDGLRQERKLSLSYLAAFVPSLREYVGWGYITFAGCRQVSGSLLHSGSQRGKAAAALVPSLT